MRRKRLRFLIVGAIILIIAIIVTLFTINHFKSKRQYKEALNEVTYVENLQIPFNSETNIKDLISTAKGKVVDNVKVNTTNLGKNTVTYQYLSSNNEEVTLTLDYEVIDITKPTIWLGASYSTTKGSNVDLLEKIMCADDVDDNPKCSIIGDYDLNTVGAYNLVFEAVDGSGNTESKNFVLYVKEPVKSSGNKSGGSTIRTPIKEAYDNYKKDDTKIGIDVSEWQGEIDFDALKNAGVEFAFVRVGGTKGIDKEYFLDKQFKRNMEGFNRVGIPVGVYFYSYAATKKSAIKDANWVLEQIKPYKVDLPVVYDWENWSFYNAFNNSFYTLNNNANAFLDTVSKEGYQGMLYGSKTYLDKIWLNIKYPIWVAQYTNTILDYRGLYDYLQICDNGKIDGINGNVDIDIMYVKD
ncbi:MAG: glycoside hydrolase family 25 protein [Bacilli bacterium]|nr:glycoside hydrolase family 25 protein [Bacilli bacterium]